jgi:hypothetical protein
MSISNTGVGGVVAGIGNKLGDWLSGPSKTYAALRGIELEHHFGAQRDQQAHENALELERLKHGHTLDRITQETAGHIVREKYKSQFGASGKLKEAQGNQQIRMANATFALANKNKGVSFNNGNLNVNKIIRQKAASSQGNSTSTTSTSTPNTEPLTPEQVAVHKHVAKMRNASTSQASLDQSLKNLVQMHGGDKRKVTGLIKARLASHRPGTPLPVR